MSPLAVIDWQSASLLLAYSAAVVAASVVGGMLPQWLRLTHTRMQLLISLVGGVMLGIAIFHMVPHALVQLGPAAFDQIMWGLMLGLLSTFFLLRFFHFHQHEPTDLSVCDVPPKPQTGTALPVLNAQVHTGDARAEHDHGAHEHHDHDGHVCRAHHDVSHGSNSRNHGHHHDHDHHHSTAPRWFGVLLGLGLHTLLDGMAMAAAVTTDSLHGHVGVLAGFGTFLAVFLHKPLDAVSITSLMSGTTAAKRLAVNLGFALMCPIGAFLFWCGADFSGQAGVFAGWALAFSAGVFLCISLSDLLPEMEFHSHNRIPLSIALLLGIAVAWGIGLVEGEGAHHHHEEHSETGAAEVHDHNGEDDHHHH